jgi:periplasmic protein TonB
MTTTRQYHCIAIAAALLMALTTIMFAQDAVRWDERETLAQAVKKVDPVYSILARQARVAGSVKLDLVIDAEGKVEKIQVVSGNPLLVGSATTAVRDWRFKPPVAAGKPAKAEAQISFNFKL